MITFPLNTYKMKNILFTFQNQTVYINYTASNGIVRKEIYLISASINSAEGIALALNNTIKKDPNFAVNYIFI